MHRVRFLIFGNWISYFGDNPIWYIFEPRSHIYTIVYSAVAGKIYQGTDNQIQTVIMELIEVSSMQVFDEAGEITVHSTLQLNKTAPQASKMSDFFTTHCSFYYTCDDVDEMLDFTGNRGVSYF